MGRNLNTKPAIETKMGDAGLTLLDQFAKAQISSGFGEEDFYSTIEEKAATCWLKKTVSEIDDQNNF